MGRSSEHNLLCSKQNIDLTFDKRKKKIPYEYGGGPNISYFHPFGCEYFILKTKDQSAKFDSKMDKGIFLEYLDTSKAYKIFNTGTLVVEESIHVKFNDGLTPNRKLLDLEDYVANMQIGPFVTPKQDEVKQSDEILPQTEGLSNQQPQTQDQKFVSCHP